MHHNGDFFFSAIVDQFPPAGSTLQHLGGPFGSNFDLLDASDNTAIKITDLFVTNHSTIGRPFFEITGVSTAVPVPGSLCLLLSGSLFLLRKARMVIHKGPGTC